MDGFFFNTQGKANTSAARTKKTAALSGTKDYAAAEALSKQRALKTSALKKSRQQAVDQEVRFCLAFQGHPSAKVKIGIKWAREQNSRSKFN